MHYHFHNCYVHFLSDKKHPSENKRIQEETEDVLQVSRSMSGEHPETAASLLYAGMFKKRENKWGEAEQKLTEALELFKKCLGRHFV